MMYYYRANVCAYNPSPWCYLDWSCPDNKNTVSQSQFEKILDNEVVKDCINKNPNNPQAQETCIFSTCNVSPANEMCTDLYQYLENGTDNNFVTAFCLNLYPTSPAQQLDCVIKGCEDLTTGQPAPLCTFTFGGIKDCCSLNCN